MVGMDLSVPGLTRLIGKRQNTDKVFNEQLFKDKALWKKQ